jgi:PhzF family phenazine biosynthesis protein
MTVSIYHVDAFARETGEGNPAAVCLLQEERRSEWMQLVAAEMNLSETAFVRKLQEGYELRWFTPETEIELCGHATLASAHIMWGESHVADSEPIRFHTRSGVLTCRRTGDVIEMNFPSTPASEAEAPIGLLDALGVRPSFVGRSKFDMLLVVECEQAVRALKPDFRALGAVTGMRGVIVSSKSDDPSFDFVSRFFAPAAGVDEDPATGSAHCCLGPFWSERLGKSEMTAFQASRRGGIVRVRVESDRVVLGGGAVTVTRGQLFVGTASRRHRGLV